MAHDPNTPPPAPQQKRGSGAQWFILGGLVVAVAVIALFMFGGDAPDTAVDPDVETGQIGTDSQDARPEAEAAPGLEENTGVPTDGEATVEGQ